MFLVPRGRELRCESSCRAAELLTRTPVGIQELSRSPGSGGASSQAPAPLLGGADVMAF